MGGKRESGKREGYIRTKKKRLGKVSFKVYTPL